MTNTNHDDVKEFTIMDIMNSTTDNYIIPIYQRNYAWTIKEVNQLLRDIKDMQETKPDKNYYIGTLVVSKQNGKFEVLDGQQRLTTFSIILSVLRKRENLQNSDKNINLDFDSRKDSSVALQNLWLDGKCNETPMQNAYETINKFLNELGGEESVGAFVNFLLGKVVVIRVTVPEHTDRNKYFETMHTRGEQLEKHEVLKARMMDALDKDNDAERHCFATIWDACADMTRFVQMSFNSNIRDSIFGGDEIPSKFSDFCKILDGIEKKEIEKKKKNNSSNSNEEPNSDDNGKKTINWLLENLPKEAPSNNEQGGSNDDGKFEVVNIDFPNFLLHVLRISIEFSYGHVPMAKECAKVVSLDDKKLIEEFENKLPKIYNNNENENESKVVKQFAMDLLKCRMLFDKYIIKKHKEKDDWEVLKLQNKKQKNETYEYSEIGTFNDVKNKQLILLQSMFHVSFSPKNHKHWLNAALRYLYQQKEPIQIDGYICFLEGLSDKFFKDHYLKNTTYEDIIYGTDKKSGGLKEITDLVNKGTDVPHYIFNYLDYLLWKDAPKIENMDDFKKSFKFTIRNSIEHFSPQTQFGENQKPITNVDCFGNLCLISSSDNSSLSNRGIADKVKKSAKSMKQQLMYLLATNAKLTWTEQQVCCHGNAMIALLQAGTKGLPPGAPATPCCNLQSIPQPTLETV